MDVMRKIGEEIRVFIGIDEYFFGKSSTTPRILVKVDNDTKRIEDFEIVTGSGLWR